MENQHDDVAEVLILGAGMSGMAAASELTRAGRRVIVVDKGRGLGGRMAVRRIGEAVFDHGAQFITARSERFLQHMQEWTAAGVASEWCRGFSEEADGHPRWRGNPNMKALPRHLGDGIDLRLGTAVVGIQRNHDGWTLALEDGGSLHGRALVLTAPVPQSLALLDAAGIDLEAPTRARLEEIRYERCLAVLAVLEGPSGMRPPGAVAFAEGPLAWMADNQIKGISPVPCVTLHASDAFSVEHWEHDRLEAGRILLEAAAPRLRSPATEFQVHGWRYSKPLQVHAEACAVLESAPPLLLAGDAFAGPKVEGATCSGWAVADFLLKEGLQPQ
jgi:renalase